jgi:hypothetical protein
MSKIKGFRGSCVKKYSQNADFRTFSDEGASPIPPRAEGQPSGGRVTDKIRGGRRSDDTSGNRFLATFRAIRPFAEAKGRADQGKGFLRKVPWVLSLSGVLLGKRLRFAFYVDTDRKVHNHVGKCRVRNECTVIRSPHPSRFARHLLQGRRQGSEGRGAAAPSFCALRSSFFIFRKGVRYA